MKSQVSKKSVVKSPAVKSEVSGSLLSSQKSAVKTVSVKSGVVKTGSLKKVVVKTPAVRSGVAGVGLRAAGKTALVKSAVVKPRKPVGKSMKVRDVFPLLSRSWRTELELRGKDYRLMGSAAANELDDFVPKKLSGLSQHALSLMDRSGELDSVGQYRDVIRGVLLKKGDASSADMIRAECDSYLRVHGLRLLRGLVQQSSVDGWKGYFLKRKGLSVESVAARQSPQFLYYLALDALLPMMEVVQVKKGGGAMQVPRPLSRISVARRIAAGWRVGAAQAKSKGSSGPRYGVGVALAMEVLAVVSDAAYRMNASRTRGLRGVPRSSLKSSALGKKIALYRLAKSNRSYRVGDASDSDSGGDDLE